jgi:hypothetical protein
MAKRHVEFKPFLAATGWVVVVQYDIDHIGLIATGYESEDEAQSDATKLNRALK